MKRRRISGYGGSSSSSSSRTPVEAADSLQSHQYAQIVDLLSEGPIKGLVDGLRSVYLDNTPVVSASGASNFSGVTLVTREGTNYQTPVDGFADTDNEVSVNVEVRAGVPVVRTLSGDIDSATITISVPQLTQTNTSTGDISGTSVSLSAFLQNNGGGFYPIPADILWSADSSEGVVGQTISIDNCYGIGITFEVDAPVYSSSYSDSGGESGDSGGESGGDGGGEGGG